jgi:hypothetical protein
VRGEGFSGGIRKKAETSAITQVSAFWLLAERTGLEPATSGVTGRHSNQLNYHSNKGYSKTQKKTIMALRHNLWRSGRDSNPRPPA